MYIPGGKTCATCCYFRWTLLITPVLHTRDKGLHLETILASWVFISLFSIFCVHHVGCAWAFILVMCFVWSIHLLVQNINFVMNAYMLLICLLAELAVYINLMLWTCILTLILGDLAILQPKMAYNVLNLHISTQWDCHMLKHITWIINGKLQT